MLKKEINMVKKMKFDNIMDATRFLKKLRTTNYKIADQELKNKSDTRLPIPGKQNRI